MADASIPGALDAELVPETEGFRLQWVQVETAEAGALFQPPSTPTMSNQGWMCEELNDPRLTSVLIRLENLKRARVTIAMVVREFIHRRIAPLQRHSRPMWAYAGTRDPMRIQVLPLSRDVLRELLRRLTGGDPYELPQNGLPLYNFKAPEALIAGMPLFDECGFLPGGDVCPRRASTLRVQTHETLVVPPVQPPRWAVLYRCPLPRLLFWVEPGLVVTTGRRWKSSPPAFKLQPRVAGSPRQATLVSRKRRSPEGDRSSTRGLR
ncbi:hypothetical protein D1007_48710 [Hordeum vulgare]|nr:hypothetical protein D1007_48710 [Hordeum vulgare]